MAKVLVIRKQDATVHTAQLKNKAFLTAYNKRQPPSKKFTIEEMDEEAAKEIPFIDKGYVPADQAAAKLKGAEKTIAAKDNEIEELKKLLEAAQKNAGGGESLTVKAGPAADAVIPGAENTGIKNEAEDDNFLKPAADATDKNAPVIQTAVTEAIPITQKPAAQKPAPAAQKNAGGAKK